MNGLVIDLPPDVRAEVDRRTGHDPDAAAAWMADAVRERLAACAQLDYLDARAARGSREAFDRVLAKVPATDSVPGDEW